MSGSVRQRTKMTTMTISVLIVHTVSGTKIDLFQVRFRRHSRDTYLEVVPGASHTDQAHTHTPSRQQGAAEITHSTDGLGVEGVALVTTTMAASLSVQDAQGYRQAYGAGGVTTRS